MPGASDERFALAVFVGSRPFADKHDVGIHVTDAENQLVAPFMQAAARAVADVGANLGEGIGFVDDGESFAGLRRGMPRLYV